MCVRHGVCEHAVAQCVDAGSSNRLKALTSSPKHHTMRIMMMEEPDDDDAAATNDTFIAGDVDCAVGIDDGTNTPNKKIGILP